MMVQVPANFDKANPCIVTATSSGSRGVYGAIATAGEWGLKHKCAVAYTDKGTGNGYYFIGPASTSGSVTLNGDTTDDIQGKAGSGAALGKNAEFVPTVGTADPAAFNAATP